MRLLMLIFGNNIIYAVDRDLSSFIANSKIKNINTYSLYL
jgi:hypothetical protein